MEHKTMDDAKFFGKCLAWSMIGVCTVLFLFYLMTWGKPIVIEQTQEQIQAKVREEAYQENRAREIQQQYQEANKRDMFKSMFKNATYVQLLHMLREAKTEQEYRKFTDIIDKKTYGVITQIELIQAIEQQLFKETHGRYIPQYTSDLLGNKALLKTEQQEEKPMVSAPITSNIGQTQQTTSKPHANKKQSATRGK